MPFRHVGRINIYWIARNVKQSISAFCCERRNVAHASHLLFIFSEAPTEESKGVEPLCPFRTPV